MKIARSRIDDLLNAVPYGRVVTVRYEDGAIDNMVSLGGGKFFMEGGSFAVTQAITVTHVRSVVVSLPVAEAFEVK